MKKNRILVIVLILISIGVYFYINNYLEKSLQAIDTESDSKILVEIPLGSTTKDIAEILYENNLIRDLNIFKYYTKKVQADSKLKAGNYLLSKDMNVDELVNTLIKGGKSGNTTNITVIEGLIMEETARTIANQIPLNYDELLSLMNNTEKFKDDYEFLKDNPNIENLQGYLMPNTYNVYINSNEENVVRILVSEFDEFYKNEIKPVISSSKLNLEDIINLSSIVEKEAVLDEERDEVAAAFLNRLDINMKLQSCATVNYAQGVWKERLSNEDIAIDSPYNTYIIEGLPPNAINSPGKLSIKAVLEPADVDYLYFVAKGDGSHYFSNNYEDHLAAKNKYLD